MIKEALDRGEINQNTKLVEATKWQYGHCVGHGGCFIRAGFYAVDAREFHQERIDTMRAYGAKVILTDGSRTIEYSRK
ncbi:MAG: hypothetical protein R2788_20350 [Saprospiraceae bacterium]